MVYGLARFGISVGTIYLDQVSCTGDEAKLGDCPSNPIGEHDCTFLEDAGVGCYTYGLSHNIAILCGITNLRD